MLTLSVCIQFITVLFICNINSLIAVIPTPVAISQNIGQPFENVGSLIFKNYGIDDKDHKCTGSIINSGRDKDNNDYVDIITAFHCVWVSGWIWAGYESYNIRFYQGMNQDIKITDIILVQINQHIQN